MNAWGEISCIDEVVTGYSMSKADAPGQTRTLEQLLINLLSFQGLCEDTACVKTHVHPQFSENAKAAPVPCGPSVAPTELQHNQTLLNTNPNVHQGFHNFNAWGPHLYSK